MSNRTRILCFALCTFVVAFGALVFMRHDNEPTCDGRTLTQWLDAYATNFVSTHTDDRLLKTVENNEYSAAVRRIGTNAIPCLLKWSADEDGPVAKFFADHQNVPGARNILRRADHNKFRAYLGFRILGTNALPSLQTMMRSDNATLQNRALNAAIFINTPDDQTVE